MQPRIVMASLRSTLSVALLLCAVSAQGQLLRIYYPDIEQGSATLVVSPTGNALLIDAGTGLKSTDDAIEDFINDLIDAGVITSLDFTIATHYDEDHIGRMENVFQLVPLPPSAVAYDRGEFGGVPGTFAYADYAFAAGFHNRTTVPVCTVLDLGGGVTATVMTVNGEVCGAAPVDISTSEQFENAASVSVVVTYGDVDIWIGGDLTGNPDFGVADVESAVAPQVGDLDIYTVNHHGSRTSSNQTFLSALAAELGITQNAATNNFGHPNAEVVTRFLMTPDSDGESPQFYQQNPSNPDDDRSDDSLATGIADCDDLLGAVFFDGFESGDTGAWGQGKPPLPPDSCDLPGTMVVLSDATSYQVHACGIPETTFPADVGPGTIGDYPPAIRRVRRSPEVPRATEGVDVEAVVGGAVAVELHFELDGVPQPPVPMTGTPYVGTIPAQPDGTQVRFRVAATDAALQTEVSPAQGYYSGTTRIATVRSNDAAEVLLPKNYGVRVEGTITAEPGLINASVTQAYVEDETGGVQIFDGELLDIDRGDIVEFVGRLEQFGGQTEVNTAENCSNLGHTVVGAGTVPEPQVVTVAEVGESLEGRLVRINNVTVVDGTIPESGSGTLTVTDDGGTSTVEIRIDADTDIPGANTPTQTFNIIGIASQFDSFVPLDNGYQILPRERTDLLSDEVNHPVVLISEIHADPAPGLAGDANGDGVRDPNEDEFIELLNTGFLPIDISGWTLSDADLLRHTFAPGTVIPSREAAVVFGGGTPTGDFGNAAANGLVFTASTGSLSLRNVGDTVTLADERAAVIQTVQYGNEGGQNQSLVRDPDYSNAPFVLHAAADGAAGSIYSPGTRITGQSFTVAQGAVILTEVLYDADGSDDGLEWVELYNPAGASIDLSDLCIGNGGSDYTSSLVSLDGASIASGDTLVVGGPDSNADNGNPMIEFEVDFEPDFQNSGADADGVALFNVRCSQVTASTVPIDAVVYGRSNTNGLIDETGTANAPEVGDAASGQSIARLDLAGSWTILCDPEPNDFVPGGPPAPPAGLLLSEVLYDPSGSDDALEWVELFNSSGNTIDLSLFSLGNGGTSYLSSQVQLEGMLAAGTTFVVGGPTSNNDNSNPIFDQVFNFDPDFQNSGSTGDGVALFDLPTCLVTEETVPVDAVVYGPNNDNGLIDETGAANPPEVGDAPSGQSIERTDLAGSWQIQATPTPNASPLD